MVVWQALARTLLDGNDLFTEFKGALTEQYVCQQLKTIEDLGVYYYTNDRGSCEIDFIVDTGEQVIPVGVKAEINLRAKSLKTYQEKFAKSPSVLRWRISKTGLWICHCMQLSRLPSLYNLQSIALLL